MDLSINRGKQRRPYRITLYFSFSHTLLCDKLFFLFLHATRKLTAVLITFASLCQKVCEELDKDGVKKEELYVLVKINLD